MPPSPPSLTLILAATPSLGIGKNGTLPWPQLKKEMGYFARVTKRVHTPPSTPGARRVNAVLMGRKTWESIPPRFRPLKDRLNIVVTRSPGAFSSAVKEEGEVGVEGPLVASSIGDALARLRSSQRVAGEEVQVERVYVIGGASVYEQALEMRECERVLLTRIKGEFECDTFFTGWDEGDWREVGKSELREFTGEGESVEGVVAEQGVEFEFCLFERRGVGE
ncbi:hypothetical protein P153DRAFT_298072 [Dothidotthia symphoricarpi CBS 119687]|uniref:Dihydrofolate reductase n=1 Tax=Dothidotthia symphoricarpi CBS 119687 TaxID=1392245 RepID=A0A6A6A1Y4_9PLEO|nr:uncharacterized protein P153DRAFT_298072 [Dothidotthia symphoricarpi CBS 119687]KAF2125982.1 hypothetical protein P153DRAFT_298072 [Dothidotthia symphoricarpi CBS 119687]